MSNPFIKNTAYTLLDLITLKKGIARNINGMKVRFPAKWSRYYPEDYESENYIFLQQQVKAGMQIIDIGAHIGLFSACSSQLTGATGRIICFEPTPGTFSILKDTLRLNHCDNVTAVQAAVSDKEGQAIFYVSSTAGCNSNSLIKNEWGGNPVGYDVKLVTIDSIVSANAIKPGLIKIDAEGAEQDVLKGGIKTFKDHKPVLILGLHPAFIKEKGDSLEAIWDLLESIPYKIKIDGKEMTKQDFSSRDLLFDVHCFAV
ncbi:MAG TPA: FkbM family methyltransferase [Chitinophagaceae bacterium]|nr:FkbM family methyltransferase [Chitinophagaceae bacterium]